MKPPAKSAAYTESGRHAASRVQETMVDHGLTGMFRPEELERRSSDVSTRGRALRRFGLAMAGLSLVSAFVLGSTALTRYNGTYEGAVAANWLILAAFCGLFAAAFGWGMFRHGGQLAQVAQRLLARARHERRRRSKP